MATYYLQNPGGNDANAGTQVAPWLTLQHAADTAVAGDTVYCEGGEVLAAQIDFDTNAGTAGNYIRYIGVNTIDPLVNDGTPYDLDGNGAVNYAMYLSLDYVYFQNFEIYGCNSHGLANSDAAYSSFINVYSHNNAGDGIALTKENGCTLIRCSCRNNTGSGISKPGIYSLIAFCDMIGNGSYGYEGQDAWGAFFYGNIVHNNTSDGWNLSGRSNVVGLFHNVIDGNGGDGIEQDGTETGGAITAMWNRITNNTGDGYDIANSITLLEDYNFLLGNGAVSAGTGQIIQPFEQSLIAGVEGYENRAGDEFDLTDDATLRRTAIQVGCA